MPAYPTTLSFTAVNVTAGMELLWLIHLTGLKFFSGLMFVKEVEKVDMMSQEACMDDSKVKIEGQIENFEQFDLEDRSAKGLQSYLDSVTIYLDGFASWDCIETCKLYFGIRHWLVSKDT